MVSTSPRFLHIKKNVQRFSLRPFPEVVIQYGPLEDPCERAAPGAGSRTDSHSSLGILTSFFLSPAVSQKLSLSLI